MTVGEGDELAEVRRSYARDALRLEDLPAPARADPLVALRSWLEEAVAEGREPEPTAMVLATVRAGDGVPDARVVLCKGLDDGVVFFTNADSAKGRQLATAPRAAVVFHWPSLERQVRCRGTVQPLSGAASDAYFATRPRGSQLGAWASEQSRPIADRDALDGRLREVEQRFAEGEVPRPGNWGGFRLVPDEVELWQGRPDRLHDRLLATRSDGWRWTRLQP